MNGHLSSAQISEWILGSRTMEAERHIQDCTECRAEIARCESGLAAFGQSVRSLAAMQPAVPDARVSAHQPAVWRWAAAATAFVFAVGLPIYWNTKNNRQELFRQDSELMERVHAQLSRSVPAPLEPLLELMEEEGKETSQ
jgi:hypothetical protein